MCWYPIFIAGQYLKQCIGHELWIAIVLDHSRLDIYDSNVNFVLLSTVCAYMYIKELWCCCYVPAGMDRHDYLHVPQSKELTFALS